MAEKIRERLQKNVKASLKMLGISQRRAGRPGRSGKSERSCECLTADKCDLRDHFLTGEEVVVWMSCVQKSADDTLLYRKGVVIETDKRHITVQYLDGGWRESFGIFDYLERLVYPRFEI